MEHPPLIPESEMVPCLKNLCWDMNFIIGVSRQANTHYGLNHRKDGVAWEAFRFASHAGIFFCGIS